MRIARYRNPAEQNQKKEEDPKATQQSRETSFPHCMQHRFLPKPPNIKTPRAAPKENPWGSRTRKKTCLFFFLRHHQRQQQHVVEVSSSGSSGAQFVTPKAGAGQSRLAFGVMNSPPRPRAPPPPPGRVQLLRVAQSILALSFLFAGFRCCCCCRRGRRLCTRARVKIAPWTPRASEQERDSLWHRQRARNRLFGGCSARLTRNLRRAH